MKVPLRLSGAWAFKPIPRTQQSYTSRRYVSNPPIDAALANIWIGLLTRPPHVIYDYLSPTPSYLLDASLADFLPAPPHSQRFEDRRLPYIGRDTTLSPLLPQGHHLVYFPPPITHRNLLPDGTDTLHFPGAPFTRRMWAGGSIVFNSHKDGLRLRARRAACIETVTDVTFKGQAGEEKIFVEIERKICRATELPDGEVIKHSTDNKEDEMEKLYIVEKRDLVFMREKSAEEIVEDLNKEERIVRPSHKPDFSISLVPPHSLLFRFSALTFNAHSIHLDMKYAQEVEGHRNLIVHGPLTLVVMLTVLRSQLPAGETIRTFDYRNLAPLYAEEEMKICVRRDPKDTSKYGVWIEGKSGGYAVKGSATTGPVSSRVSSPVPVPNQSPQGVESELDQHVEEDFVPTENNIESRPVLRRVRARPAIGSALSLTKRKPQTNNRSSRRRVLWKQAQTQMQAVNREKRVNRKQRTDHK